MEPPVVRSRGRPRKRRNEEENGTVDRRSRPEAKKQAVGTRAIALVGRYVLKEFEGSGVFLGKVVYYECGLYRVNYEDGDFEDLDSRETRGILLDDNYFDDDLIQRRTKLDELVLNSSVKIIDRSEDPKKDDCKVEPHVSSELQAGLSAENDELRAEEDADSLSDSSAGSGQKDSVSDTESPPLPPLQLPPSSGTIGVPEQCVSHLFSVYGFLRSFSIRLFLCPFSLDDFVGSLNCRVSNTLFDAIHVSLMRGLKHHLETLSFEGSKLASKCLRCNDWSLLDTLTWPVFVNQYIAVNGYTKGPEWNGFYDEVLNGEYYLLPVSRKLSILQILCDDVLESEELKAEMSMREASEVGMDYDAEDILLTESGPRRVQPRYAKTYAGKDKEVMKSVSESNAVKLPGNSILNFRDTERTEDVDVDGNGDECRLCGMDGTLLCCDGCPSAYHSRCIGVMKSFIPDGPWYCPECKINISGLTIAKGTSLRGAEIFGKDAYGQVFMGTCNHLLVLDISSEFCLRYYNQNDIPKVLQVLCESTQHRPFYSDICKAILQYWNIPESVLPLSVTTITNVNSANPEDHAELSSLLPSLGEEDHKAVNLVKAEFPVTAASEIHGDNMVSSPDSTLVTTQRENSAPVSCGDTRPQVCAIMNIKHPQETKIKSVISTGSVGHQGDLSYLKYRSSFDRSSANDVRSPMNLSLQIKEGNQVGSGKLEPSITNDFMYMGSSYKPLLYVNCYMHGDFAASAAAKLAVISSEDSRPEGHVSESQRKFTSGNTYLQAKAFSLTVSRFFWPSSEKKLIEVPRERCGWCLSCKAPVSSKRGCMLNHAALSATKSAMKVLAGLGPVRTGDGILPSIATYLIYLEESLCGLVVGPFLSSSYRRQWRERMDQAISTCAVKLLLLELEENIRVIAFSGEWVKLMDDWMAESFMIQSAASTVGTTQKRAPTGRRYNRQSASDEVTSDGCHESNFAWWHGGKFTKFIFQKAVLPKSMIRKAARQGGLRKIFSISYADNSEVPRRSRQLVWRAAVQMSRNASQLALQVRYLDFHLRWTDLIRPEQNQNLQDGKGQETEASTFRNANICDKKLVDGKILYGIAFGSQKHLPSRVMKNVVEIDQDPGGNEKYWFFETRIPLYLVKEYEEGMVQVSSDKEHLNLESELQKKQYLASKLLHRRQLKAACKDIFLYLTCKRDNLELSACSVCQLGVVTGTALKCIACQGYCHEGCSISSTISANEQVGFLTTCKQCYHAKTLTQKETSNESPTSPLVLQGREHRPVTVLKGPKPKCIDQTLTSIRTNDTRHDMKQDGSDPASATKSRQRKTNWGIIWRKKNEEDTGIDFRLKNILLKGGCGLPQVKPVCRLCQQPYRSDLMYICCKTCNKWYHAEAVELEESRITEVVGFKCCKCRRIKSPVCPYINLNSRMQVGKKTRMRGSNKEHSGADSDSGTCSELRECEPATPMFPTEDVSRQDNDPFHFSLSTVEPITEPNPEVDVEWNTASGPGLQKLPVRRHINKHDGDGDGSYGSNHPHAEPSTHYEMSNLCKPEYDTDLHLDSNLLNGCESMNFDCMDFEPNTYFSLTELLLPDDNSQFAGADVSRDLLGYMENSSTPNGLFEEHGTISLMENSEPATSFQGSVYACWQCSQMEPAPDLSCEICGLWIHSQCSPWLESPSSIGSWRCGGCREWR